MSEDLKPCPFCGNSAHIKKAGKGGYRVECCCCDCTLEAWRTKESDTLTAWNCRSETVEVRAAMEVLLDKLDKWEVGTASFEALILAKRQARAALQGNSTEKENP